MRKLYLSSITLILFFSYSGNKINAQGGVAINVAGDLPDSSAMIDVSSLSKGALLPRMSTAQRNAIANPGVGLTIFNTDCRVYNYNAGTPANPLWATINASNALIAGISIVVSPLGPICAGTSTTFSATPAAGINNPNYQWQVNGQNVGSNSPIYITSSIDSGDVVICILSSNAHCVAGSPATSNGITMSINPGPSTPGGITGDTSPCPNSAGNVYSVNAANNATSYNWTVPNDATITAGQGTTSITVTWGSNSGNVSVQSINNCATSPQISLSVNTNSVPGTPGPIGGPTIININSTGIYSISPVANATSYVWTVTNGAITAGQGTDSINVTWQSNTGLVSVVASNQCGSSSAQNLTTGPQAQTFTYTGATQYFTVPLGVTSLTIEAFGAQGGNTNSYTGGYGADIKGTFTVSPGDVLSIGVGQQAPENSNAGGGGGSSGVRDGGNLLLVAGAGGGAGDEGPTATDFAMSNAVTGTSGQSTYGCDGGTGNILGTGGTGGYGGGAGTNPCGDWPQGGGGAGVYSNGGTPTNSTNGNCSGGLSTGAGGSGDDVNGGGNGGWGFTGGGGGSYGGGGGGGYSGGAGGASSPAGYYVTGGGGGSYNGGTNQTNTAGVQNGNGQVVLTW